MFASYSINGQDGGKSQRQEQMLAASHGVGSLVKPLFGLATGKRINTARTAGVLNDHDVITGFDQIVGATLAGGSCTYDEHIWMFHDSSFLNLNPRRTKG